MLVSELPHGNDDSTKQDVYRTVDRDQESPSKQSGQLHGSKFRQSEMVGFRRKSAQNSVSSSLKNSIESLKDDEKSTERLRPNKNASQGKLAYVSGYSF